MQKTNSTQISHCLKCWLQHKTCFHSIFTNIHSKTTQRRETPKKGGTGLCPQYHTRTGICYIHSKSSKTVTTVKGIEIGNSMSVLVYHVQKDLGRSLSTLSDNLSDISDPHMDIYSLFSEHGLNITKIPWSMSDNNILSDMILVHLLHTKILFDMSDRRCYHGHCWYTQCDH